MATYKFATDMLAKCPVERKILRIKSKLIINIVEYIREKELRQCDAAKLFGISQPRVSNIVNGQFSKVTVDELLRINFTINPKLDIGKFKI